MFLVLAAIFAMTGGFFAASAIWWIEYMSLPLTIRAGHGIVEIETVSGWTAADLATLEPNGGRFYINYNNFPENPFQLPNYSASLWPADGRSGNRMYRKVVISLWIPLVILAGLLTLLLVRERGRRRLEICLECNYDLRGNTSGRCPECGTSVPAVSSLTSAG